MQADFAVRNTPVLRFTTPQQIQEIHNATLEVLRRTGVKVYEEEALGLLKEAGADVQGELVRIPEFLVEEALRSAPSSIAVSSRNGSRAMALEAGKVYFGTGSDTPMILDHETGAMRPTLKSDVVRNAIICDHLPNIDFVMSMGLVSDVPTHVSDLHQFEAMLANTEKPLVYTAHDRQELAYILEMAELVAGGEDEFRRNPFAVLYAEPISPLMHSKEAVEKLLYCAQKGAPVIYTVGIMAGATAPVTSAGLLVVANAELLSGLVMAQLKRKGTPVIYGGMVTAMDMATGIFSYSAPELYLRQAIFTEMARFYGLPIFGVGGCSDSCAFDQQAGFEQAYSLLMASLSGVNLVHDVGYLGQGMVASHEMLVMSNEGIGLFKRLLRGIEVGPEDLALDAIHEVGPGGHFVQHEHTLRHFRQEMWVPRLFNRKSPEVWKRSGSLTLGERVKEEVTRILQEHHPKALARETLAGMAEILRRAEEGK